MIYALGAANSSGRSNEAKVRAPLPMFRTPKKNVRRALSRTKTHDVRKVVETREEALIKEVLEEMFIASRTKFFAVAYSILRNRDDAEDAVQEAFFLAYRQFDSFEGRSTLRTWLIRIVVNVALMMLRKRKLSAVRAHSENSAWYDDAWTERIADLQPDPEMIYAERETLQFIDEKLGKLKPALRRAFTMTFFDDLSTAEASAMLGISSGTFKARLYHARRKLVARTDRSLVAPIRRASASSSDSWKRKGPRSMQALES